MIIFILGTLGIGFFAGRLSMIIAAERRRRRGITDEKFAPLGSAVEVDCRACGKFNRVPAERLRDRPKCGRCKERLMPGRKVVVCHTRNLDGVMRVELDALWKDEDRLWQCIADHIVLQVKAKREAENPDLHVVN